MPQTFARAVQTSFKDIIYKILGVSFLLNFLALDYIILNQSTTIRILSGQNTAFYNWTTLGLSVVTAVLFAVSAVMLVFIIKQRQGNAKEAAPTSVFGTFFGAIASGCPVCGAWLLPLFGIAGSLAVFPFQGLEIKVLAIVLLTISIFQSTNVILGICKPGNKIRRLIITVLVILAIVSLLFVLPRLPAQYKFKFQQSGVSAPTVDQINLARDIETLFDQVNPREGFAINASYSNIGYRLVEDGVIDLDKFKAVYERAGTPLSEQQLKVFSADGLDEPIVINRQNSYFLLNLFWAFGLANENPILTEGKITQYGDVEIGSFASTGGWTIATKPLAEYFAKSDLAPLNEEQQAMLQNVAENTYRPCCGNSTAFPDCNHGMALLGVLELIAANGADEDEMFEAAKYFSAFWFPSQALDVATFFKVTDNLDFADVDPRVFVSRDLFSGRGWSALKGWLERNVGGGTQQAVPGGGGCGVESGAPRQTAPQQSPQIRPQGGGGCGV